MSDTESSSDRWKDSEELSSSEVEENEQDELRKQNEKTTIKQLQADHSKLVEDASYYILDIKWWNRWKSHVCYDWKSSFPQKKPHSIINDNLLNTDGSLKRGKSERYDYIIVSEPVWEKLIEWYGGGPAIVRKCVKSGRNHLSVEVRLLNFNLVRSTNADELIPCQMSKTARTQDIMDKVLETWPDLTPKNIRLWDFSGGSRLKHLKDMTEDLDSHQIMRGQKILVEERKKNGKWPTDRFYRRNFQPTSRNSYYSSPTLPGQTGLCNLGNTCFMNSSLQCLSSVAPLTDFFLSGRYRTDINPQNPLSMNGELAEDYYELVKELWSSQTSVVEPRQFKYTLGKFAPQFSGYDQHDSQELLAFLLDGLHEDLNRITDKPFTEKLESDGRPDEIVAAESWDRHKLRNDSIIVDNFQGQLKSTVKCPDCDRVSTTFDPFMYLSIPLVREGLSSLTITYHPLDSSQEPIRYGITMDKHVPIQSLREEIAQIAGIDKPNNLVIMDVYQHRFTKRFTDRFSVSDISNDDIIHAYDLGEPDDESVLIRIINRKSDSVISKKDLFGAPLLLRVDKKCTYRQLYANVIEALTPYLKKPVSKEIELQEGNVPVVQSATHQSAHNRPYYYASRKIVPDKEPPKYGAIFNLIPLDNYAYPKRGSFYNDDQPLDLRENDQIGLNWITDYRLKFYDESVAKKAKSHESCKEIDGNGEDRNLTLDKCLSLFTQEEQLGVNDTWYCSACSEHKQAFKKFDLYKLPDQLIIHLKRFSYDGMWRDKLDDVVQFPLEGLDLSNHLVGPSDGEVIYDLHAISNHYGGLGGGHYTAYTKHRTTGEWLSCDDSSVSPESDSRLVSSAAYVLFYKKKSLEYSSFQEPEELEISNEETYSSSGESSEESSDETHWNNNAMYHDQYYDEFLVPDV
eukprot:TRINITY_DN3896_c0_g1_i1.p1 TRINITY_DN3896_c0_g1~~TRINITY_DN3896_c0_g1_i1.p1  ORF type:complete len:937 (-),score=208.84 TRINITY_DN3896_c0_g1_i1:51-2777(-)